MEAQPPKAEPPKRKRRWFQFSLRMLLIGVTLLAVVCGYVAHEAQLVRERQAWLGDFRGRYILHGPYSLFVPGHPEQAPSKLRLWMGDKPEECIIWQGRVSPEEKEAAAALFPEADFIELL